jgi:chaperonin cofactor prefoldin
MELDDSVVDYSAVISELVARNAEYELRVATLKSQVASLSDKLDVARQMRASQHISPDVAKLLANLDIQ